MIVRTGLRHRDDDHGADGASRFPPPAPRDAPRSELHFLGRGGGRLHVSTAVQHSGPAPRSRQVRLTHRCCAASGIILPCFVLCCAGCIGAATASCFQTCLTFWLPEACGGERRDKGAGAGQRAAARAGAAGRMVGGGMYPRARARPVQSAAPVDAPYDGGLGVTGSVDALLDSMGHSADGKHGRMQTNLSPWAGLLTPSAALSGPRTSDTQDRGCPCTPELLPPASCRPRWIDSSS